MINCSRNVLTYCEQNDLSKARSNTIAIAIEEMLLLIREHSLKDRGETVNLRILLYKDDVVLRIRYNGDAFNPLMFYRNLNLSEKPTLSGALGQQEFIGLKMVVDIVKNTEYCQTFGVNNVTITI